MSKNNGLPLALLYISPGWSWGTPIPASPITRQHTLLLFLPGIHDIIILQEELQAIGKIVKYITDSAVHILRAHEKQKVLF